MFSAEYDENSISPLEDGTVNNVYAPRGGSVAYKQAREWGAVPGRFVVVGCTAEQGERWINEIETQRDVASAIMEAVKTLIGFLLILQEALMPSFILPSVLTSQFSTIFSRAMAE